MNWQNSTKLDSMIDRQTNENKIEISTPRPSPQFLEQVY